MIVVLVIALVALLSILITVGVNGLLGVFLSFLYYIAKWILMVIDFCQSLMRKLCGLEPVMVDGEPKDILFDVVLGNSDVQTALLAILALSIILVFGFAMVQIIRLEYTTEGSKNAKGPIIKKCIKSIFLFCLIPFCAFIGIYFSNQLLAVVNVATTGQNSKSTSIAGTIFIYAAEDANIYRSGYAEWSWCGWNRLDDVLKSRLSFGLAGYDYDTDTGILYDGDDAVTGGEYKLYKDNGGKGSITGGENVHPNLTNAEAVDACFCLPTYMTNGVEGIDYALKAQISGPVKSIKDGETLNFTNAGAVKYFYNLKDMDFFMLFVPGWFCLKILVTIVFGLVMRLYKVAVLFIVSPFPVAMTVLDDGASLNKWKSKFLSETFSAYSVVAGLNIFLMLLPVMSEIEFFETASVSILGAMSSISSINLLSGFALAPLFNKLCQMIIILCGCYMIKDIVGIIGDLLGTGGNLISDGEGMQKNIGEVAAKAGTVAMGGLTLAAAGATAIGGLAAKGINKLGVGSFAKHNNKKAAKLNADAADLESQATKLDHDTTEKEKKIQEIKDKANKQKGKKKGVISAADQAKIDQYQQDIDNNNAKSASLKSEAKSKRTEAAAFKNKKSNKAYQAINTLSTAGIAMSGTLMSNLVGGAVKGTKLFKGMDSATGGMLTSDGRAKLKEQVSKTQQNTGGAALTEIDDWMEDFKKGKTKTLDYSATKTEKKDKKGNVVKDKNGNVKYDYNYERETTLVANKFNPFERSYQKGHGMQTHQIVKETVGSIDADEIVSDGIQFDGVINGIVNGSTSDSAQADIANNLQKYLQMSDVFGTKDSKQFLQQALNSVAQAQNYKKGSSEYNRLMDNAKQNAARAQQVGGVVKIDRDSIAKLQDAVKKGANPTDIAKGYGEQMQNLIGKAIQSAQSKIGNIKADSKTANSTQELLRELITAIKGIK